MIDMYYKGPVLIFVCVRYYLHPHSMFSHIINVSIDNVISVDGFAFFFPTTNSDHAVVTFTS